MSGSRASVVGVQQSLRSIQEVFVAQHALLTSHYDAWCMIDGQGRIQEPADMSFFFTASSLPATSLAGRCLLDFSLAGLDRDRVSACLAEARETTNVTKLQAPLGLDETELGAAEAVDLPAWDAELTCKTLPGLGVPLAAALPTGMRGMPWAFCGLFVGIRVLAERKQRRREQQQPQQPQPPQQQPRLQHPQQPEDASEASDVDSVESSVSMEKQDSVSCLESWARAISFNEGLEQIRFASESDHQAEDVDADTTCSERTQATWWSKPYSLVSVARGMPRLPIVEMSCDSFVHVASVVPLEVRSTVRRMVEIARNASGGCSLAVADIQTWEELRDNGLADYQIVDRGEQPEDSDAPVRWEKGYMNSRIKGMHCRDQAFLEAVQEFSTHTDKDRWPENHEAEGLPKDGFVALLCPDGYCLKSAVRLVGLPAPPFTWDRVGTRHYSALSLAWALRFGPSAVVVRSDSGSIHCICFDEARGIVVKTSIEA